MVPRTMFSQTMQKHIPRPRTSAPRIAKRVKRTDFPLILINELGEAEAKIDNKPLRAVKIQITGAHSCWPIIKEIALK